ncbi:lipopolysaccharide biosynthesis protein [Halomonas denitrificans]|uniref:lipopolysaccharide biosynthesis protein n=1 Tax=Halomonas denitrificans TaxID=370769 RepID=UPI001C998C82|nr:oligosaccharide flippase family protein [Halomonas denitrificans]MBY5969540.1 oligosaccharide flippase family protein [Halomonas denitrificans]
MKRRLKAALGLFSGGVGVLVSGAAAAQLLTIAAAPILTRLYGPEDFGILAVFTALISMITVVASFRYEMAIPLPKEDDEAASILAISLIILLFVIILAFIIVNIGGQYILKFLDAKDLSTYIYLIPIGVATAGFYQIFHRWSIRSKKFSNIASTRILQSIGTTSIQVLGFKFGTISLLLGYALGQGLGAAKLANVRGTIGLLKKVSIKECLYSARKYKEFPIYATWTGLLNSASLQLAPVIFVFFYGSSAAGLYALTHRVLSIPANLIGSAVGSVFISEAPDAKRKGKLAILVHELHYRLTLIATLPLIVVLAAGPSLFSLVFGHEWKTAGVYAQVMAPWLYTQFKWTPLSSLALVLELQRELLVADVLLFFARLASIYFSWLFFSDIFITIACFSLTSACLYAVRTAWFLDKSGSKFRVGIGYDVVIILVSSTFIALNI